MSVDTAANEKKSVWLPPLRTPARSQLRLFCFPYAGGSASAFARWPDFLPPTVDVRPVQLPGRWNRMREAPFTRFDDALRVLAQVLPPFFDRPFAFFGHSMGASIAFEVARRLESRGVRLAVLFVSGRPAPSMPRRGDQVHLSDDAAVLAEMKRLSGTESELLEDDDFVRMVLPVVRNDYKAIETYRYTPGTNVSCPVLAMIGDDDPKVNQAEAEGWRSHTSGRFDLRVYRGGHFYLNDHREAVNRLLVERLTAVTAPS